MSKFDKMFKKACEEIGKMNFPLEAIAIYIKGVSDAHELIYELTKGEKEEAEKLLTELDKDLETAQIAVMAALKVRDEKNSQQKDIEIPPDAAVH